MPLNGKSIMENAARQNRLLAFVSEADLALLQPHLHMVNLQLKLGLEAANTEIFDCYFLTSGIASVVATGRNGKTIEVGLIGSEGVTGSAAILGVDKSPNATFMQVEGQGFRISIEDLRDAMDLSKSLSLTLTRYVAIFMIQNAQTALVNGKAGVVRRLARWLLMTQDRSPSRQLSITHEFMALMLGVRRPGVTDALHMLEGYGAVRARRNQVTITNRTVLEKAADWTYGVAEAEYERFFGTAENNKTAVSLDGLETIGE